MKKLIKLFICVGMLSALSISFKANTFLSSQDPKNYFDIFKTSPHIAVTRVESIKKTNLKDSFYNYQFKVIYTIKGDQQKNIQVIQEKIFPDQEASLKEQDLALIFYSPLPSFNIFTNAKKQGVEYRLFGGQKSFVLLNEWNLSEIVSWIKQIEPIYIHQKNKQGEKNLFIESLKVPEAKIREDAAQKLAGLKLTQGALSSSQVNSILLTLKNIKLSSLAQTNLIKVLGRNSSHEELANIANSSVGIQKWVAIQQLEKLGFSWKLEKLIEDFNQLEEPEKLKPLKIIVQYKKDQASPFLIKLLESNEKDNIKAKAIETMVEFFNPDYEKILLSQLQTRDLNLKTYAMVALGKTQSKKALPKLIQLLDDPHPRIHGTAKLALEQSQDPEAKKILKERYERVGEGHVH